jgi:phage baseplate assembly protein V
MSDITDHQRVMNMVARGRLSATQDDEGMQFAQVSLLRGEAKARVERFQQYGFSGIAPRGSEVVAVFVGGSRAHGVIVSIDNRASRIRGQVEGEVAIYSDEGDFIVLKRGNKIEIATDTLIINADVAIHIRAPNIHIEGNIHLNGDLTSTGSIYAPHGSVGGG